jgi:glycosyltransferase involved in cell wall biosynthesis
VSALGAQVREAARGRTVVSFLGTIQSRKGFESFLRLLDAADPEHTYFLIAGKFNITQKRFSQWTLAYWKKMNSYSPENVMIHNGAVEDDQDYYDLFRQSDVIWGAYENWPHSSNVLTLAAAFEKPIFVNEGYLMAERVRTFGLGVVLPRDCSAEILAAALEQIEAHRSSQCAESFFQSQAFAQLQLVLSTVEERIES